MSWLKRLQNHLRLVCLPGRGRPPARRRIHASRSSGLGALVSVERLEDRVLLSVDLKSPEVTAPADRTADATPTVTWTSLPDAAGYELEIYDVNRGARIITHSGLTGTAWTVPPLKADVTYEVYVRGTTASGTGPWSDPHTFLVARPDPPNAAMLPARTYEATPTIEWQAVAGAAGYDVQIYNVSQGRLVIDAPRLDGPSLTVTSPLAPGLHEVFLRSLNDAGDAGRWSRAELLVERLAPPTFTAPGAGTRDMTPTIAWRPVEDADVYQLQLYSVTRGRLLARETELAETTYAPDSSLEFDAYQVFVRAMPSAGGPGVWGVHTFNVQIPAPQVTGPPNPMADTTPTVTWTEVEEAAAYHLQIYSTTRGRLIVEQTGLSDTSSTMPPLGFDTYQVFVRGLTEQGVPGRWSGGHQFSVVDLHDGPEGEALLKELIARDRPQLRDPELDDWTKVSVLRDWAYETIDWGSGATLINGQVASEFFQRSAPAAFAVFLQDRAGTFCGGAAYALKELYRLYGFDAYMVDIGNPQVMTHTVTLVRLQHGGREIVSVQDPTFNLTYLDSDGLPYDYFQLLADLRHHRHEDVLLEEGPAKVRELIVEKIPDFAGYLHMLVEDLDAIPRLPDGRYKAGLRLTLSGFDAVFSERIGAYLASRGRPPQTIYLYLDLLGIHGGDLRTDLLRRAGEIIAGG